MSVREMQVHTQRTHAPEDVRRAVASVVGVSAELVHMYPESLDVPVTMVLRTTGSGSFRDMIIVVIDDDDVAPQAKTDLDLGRPLARLLADDIACSPDGVPGVDDDDPSNEDLWAVIDPQGVVRLAREIDTGDDDDFKLDIDPTPIPL
jgi:hypothetical protein